MKRFFNWLAGKISPKKTSVRFDRRQTDTHLRRTGAHKSPVHTKPTRAAPKSRPETVDLDPHVAGRIEDNGPGKNVLIRNKYVREDTGTHDTLTILDDSMVSSEEETGLDPYNTGQFDRSKNWDKRFRN